MSVQIDSEKLNQILRTAAVVRADNECYVTVSTDEIHLQAYRENKDIYFEHSLPFSELFTSHGDETGSFWIELEFISQCLRRTTDSEVHLAFPFEGRPGSSLVLQSDGLTYRCPSIVRRHGHYLPDVLDAEPVSSCSIRHGVFDRAVKAADLVGGSMQVQIEPGTKHIEFSAAGVDGSNCTYVVPPDDIEKIHGSPAYLPISIDALQELTPLIPDNNLAALSVFDNHLQYTVEHPSTDATLQLYIAERLGAVPE